MPVVLSYMKSQSFEGANTYIYKFCGCLAPVAPVLNRLLDMTRKYLLLGYVPSPSGMAKKENIKEII